jgi:hypothetical protein
MRKLASNIILILFFILVGVAGILSDIFQRPTKNGVQAIEQEKIFAPNYLNQIQRLSLKNKSGIYLFERNEKNQISPWRMISPRVISANSLFMEKIFTSLNSIKIKKVFPDEKINNSNFSIDKPTSTLTLIDPTGKTMTIFVGLMNTIDNSTYLKIQGKPGIYHVEAPSVSLENATIQSLVESQIISIERETILVFKIFHGNKKNASPTLEIRKKNGLWFDHEDNTLSDEKIDDYFQDLSNLKSSFIIDKQTDAQKKQIANLAHNPAYVVSIEDIKGNTIDYRISELVKDLSDINLKNEEKIPLRAFNKINNI